MVSLFLTQVMITNLEQVLSMVLKSFQHPHPRVRWAAINAIGQLSTDLGPELQVHYHAQVLPALAGAMEDFHNPRVQVCDIRSISYFLLFPLSLSHSLPFSFFFPMQIKMDSLSFSFFILFIYLFFVLFIFTVVSVYTASLSKGL
jgi:hypothetical protein